MQKTSKNNLIRCVIFLLIMGMAVWYLCQVFTIADSDENRQIMKAFYNDKENTYDGVYLGTSAANRYWIGPAAYEKYGFTIGGLATASQPLQMTKYLIEEVEKTQNPKLYIIDHRAEACF